MFGVLTVIGAALMCVALSDYLWDRACKKYNSNWACLNYVLGSFAAILAIYMIVILFISAVIF